MAGYIGSKAVVVSSGAERKKTFAITTSTTSLTGLSYTPTYVHVFHNGIRLVDSSDYTATNGTSITLSNAAANGDEVVVISYSSFQVADAYNKSESDTRFINTAGDTLTGTLGGTAVNLSGDLSAVNTTLTGYLRGPATFTIDPAVHGNNSGLVIIAGNLQVDGTQTTINSTTLTVDDLNLTLASGAADSAAANGAGITIDGASASLTYVHSGTKFLFNKPLDVTGNIGVTGTVDGVDIQTLNTTAGAALPKAGGTMTGDLQLYKATPIITLKRSDNATLPGLSWQGAGGVEAASIKMDGTSGMTNSLVMSTHNGSTMAERLRLMTSAAGGITVTGTIVATGNILPSEDVRILDGKAARFGTGNDFSIYNDGSDTTLRNSTSNQDIIFLVNDDGAANTEAMRIDASTNRVGIGTDAPGAPLHIQFSNNDGGVGGHLIKNTNTGTTSNFASLSTQAVNGTIQGTFGSAHYASWGGAVTFAGSQSAHPFNIITSNAVRATFLANGNVGIGTDSPLTKLNIHEGASGAAGVDFGLTLSSDRYQADYGVGIAFRPENNSTSYKTKTAILASGGGYGYNQADLHFCIDSDNTITNEVGLADSVMTLKKGGNVGIGTSSPTVKLDVVGPAGVTSFTGSTALGMVTRGSTGATDYSGIDFRGNNQTSAIARIATLSTGGGTYLQFGTSNNYSAGITNTAMTIDTVGKVGIGTDTPTQKLEIEGDVRIKDARSLFFKRHGDNYAWRIRNESAAAGGTYGFNGSNDLVFEVVSNSNVNATPAVGSHSVYTSSANTLVLTETGKVGIGTPSPGSKLEVYNSATSGNTQLHIHNDKAGDAAVLRLEGKRTSLNDTGQVLFVNSGNIVAKIDARSAADDGALRFFTSASGTGNNIVEAMSIATNKAVAIGGPVTITSDTEYQFKINASSGAGASMAAITAGSYAYTVHQNSSKQWRSGAYGGSSYSIVNQTDGVYPLILSSSGAATFHSTVQATELICTSNGITFSGADGKTIIKTGRRTGTGTYTLFTNGASNTQSAGTVEIWGIYGTPSGGSYANYVISGNRSIQTVITHTQTNSVPVVSLAWNGAALQVSNSNGSLYYNVRVTLAEIGNSWAPTWGNFPGMS